MPSWLGEANRAATAVFARDRIDPARPPSPTTPHRGERVTRHQGRVRRNHGARCPARVMHSLQSERLPLEPWRLSMTRLRNLLSPLVLACALTAALLPACAGSQANRAGTTTTTSAVVERTTLPRCVGLEAVCVTDVDCCSLWCIEGSCQ
jgi:hypothetical protein